MRVCPHCGAARPSTFDAVCASCGNFVEEPSSATEAAVASIAITENTPPPEVSLAPSRKARPEHRCPKCQASQFIDNAFINDSIYATVQKEPPGMYSTGTVSQILRARICGNCGFVELYVDDPATLLRAAREATERFAELSNLAALSKRAASSVRSQAENACLACGAAMPEDVSTCTACGWTY